jgi:hypothetical protein
MGARIVCTENSNLPRVLKTLSELMILRNRLWWRDDRASPFRAGNVARPCGEKSGSALRTDHRANAIGQDRARAWESAIWCLGRETYAITDNSNRCLSLIWWRERLAQWRSFAPRKIRNCGSFSLLAGSLALWEASLWPRGFSGRANGALQLGRRAKTSFACQLGVDQQPCGFDQFALQACCAKRCGVSIGAVDQKGQSIAEPARIAGAEFTAQHAKALAHFLRVAAGDRGAGMMAARKFGGEIDKGTATKLGGSRSDRLLPLAARRSALAAHHQTAEPSRPTIAKAPILLLGRAIESHIVFSLQCPTLILKQRNRVGGESPNLEARYPASGAKAWHGSLRNCAPVPMIGNRYTTRFTAMIMADTARAIAPI